MQSFQAKLESSSYSPPQNKKTKTPLFLRCGRRGYVQGRDCSLERRMREIAGPAVNLELIRCLKLLDGLSGQRTILPVEQFQTSNKLEIDGWAGKLIIDARKHLLAKLHQISHRLH